MRGSRSFLLQRNASFIATGSPAARGRMKVNGTPNRQNYFVIFFRTHVIYKCGCGPHNTSWQAACGVRHSDRGLETCDVLYKNVLGT